MKRSEINNHIKEALAFFKDHRFHLPEWAQWSVQKWKEEPEVSARIKSLQMGWDITDFGTGDFYDTGLILFCMRNGLVSNKKSKPYAEKIMIVEENQKTPWHYHSFKEEDIINRGGGNLIVELAHTNKDDELDLEREVQVSIDEIQHTFKPKEKIYIKPGQSITLTQKMYHTFYGEAGCGKVLTGEVSRVNDDNTDNRFLTAPKRFAEIVEDEDVLYPLWSELP